LDQLGDLQDQECVERCRDGNSEACSELVRRHQDRVFRFILRMTGCREDALELTQDTFIKALRALPSWRPDALFRTWLLSIAGNTARDSLRSRKRVKYVSIDECEDIEDGRASPHDQLEVAAQCRLLESALRKLSDECREIILLREVEGLSYSQIADTLDICEGTVKSRIARARAMILKELKRKW
jgi:RNA polymerase sigma-70 factor (ECF subfamily)